MSEKRFILAEDSNGLFSIFDNEDPEDEPLNYDIAKQRTKEATEQKRLI